VDLAAVIALVIEVVVLSQIEFRVVKTRITPFNVLAFPYTVLIIFAYFFASPLGFIPLSGGSVVVWIGGLFLLWTVGMVLMVLFVGSDPVRLFSTQLKSSFPTETYTVRLAMWIGTLSVPLLCYGVIRAKTIAGGWMAIGSPEFKDAYLHGLPAHIVVLCLPIVILLLGTATSKSRLQLAVAAIIVLFLLIGQEKGNTLQPLIGGLLYRLATGRAAISLKSIGILVLCGALVFAGINLFTWSAADVPLPMLDADTYFHLARYSCFYALSGPLAFDDAVRYGTRDLGLPPEAIFSSFINLYRATTGSAELLGAGSTKGNGVAIDLIDDSVAHNSNVYTFFGTLYLYLGGLGASLYVAVATLLIYLLLILASSTRNELFLALYCFVCAQLFFGFFEFYFWHLTTLEVTFLMIGAFVVQSLSRTNKKYSTALFRHPSQ